MKPSSSTIKALCTRSGEFCAFYGCGVPLVDELASDLFAGEICHIRALRPKGPRYDMSQTDEDRNSFANLILLCANHHKEIDSDEQKYSVEFLLKMKEDAFRRNGAFETRPIDRTRAERLLKKYEIQAHGTVNIHAQNVTIKGTRASRQNIVLPGDVIGGSSQHHRYIDHLIGQYQEFAAKQEDRNFRYPAIYAAIKRRFGAKWNLIPVVRFPELAAYLQQRIDRTKLGKINRSKGNANYSTFQQYGGKYAIPKS
jgi:hypothetical protein